MRKIFHLISGLVLFSLLSCAANGTRNEKGSSQSEAAAQVKKAGTLNADDFKGKLNELLTLDMAVRLSGFEAPKALTEYNNKASVALGGEYKPPRECAYLWDNGRSRSVTVGPNTINTPYRDKIGIKGVSNTTLERFKRNYGVLTAAQKEAAVQKLEEETEKNKSADSPTQAGQQMSETGKTMIQGHQAEEIENVGDAATWYPPFNELKVFYQGLTFALVVDISDDNKLNRAKSIELARWIINEKLN